MGFFTAKDGSVYRRWVNIIPSVLMSGGGHYLAGRKRAGLLWFSIIFFTALIRVFLYFSPLEINYAFYQAFSIFGFVLWLVMLIDACRVPIPRLKKKIWVVYLFVVITIFVVPLLIIRQFVFQPFSIPTGAMQPTLMGDERAPYGIKKTGDHFLVSKMAYWFHAPQRGDIVIFSTDIDKIVLGENEYLVFGDNSKNSLDGRYYGAIKRNNIRGKVILIYWPFERKGRPE